MATSGNATGAYPSRPFGYINIEVYRHSVSGTSARWGWRLYGVYTNSPPAWDAACLTWNVMVAGQGWSGCASPDFRNTNVILYAEGVTGWIDQGTGAPEISFAANHGGASFGVANAAGSFRADQLASLPGVPPSFGMDLRDITRLRYTWGRAADNGSAVDQYQIQAARDRGMTQQITAPGFGPNARTGFVNNLPANSRIFARIRSRNGIGWGPWSGVREDITRPNTLTAPWMTARTAQSVSLAWNAGTGNAPIQTYQVQLLNAAGRQVRAPQTGTARTLLLDGLTPDTPYQARVRYRNSVDWGDWSPVINVRTLEAGLPTVTYTPDLSGAELTIRATPPANLTVTNYESQRRIVQAGSPITTFQHGATHVVSNLTPGTQYEWRTRARYSGGETDWTPWVRVWQPSTNTNPGDYFDGATAAKTDTSYAWDGTVNNSTSRAIGTPPTGWRTFLQGAADSGGTGVVARISGGRQGAFAARTTFFTDATAAGFHGGTSIGPFQTFEAQEGGTYAGGVYVHPSRAQRLAAEIAWLDADRNVIGYVQGADELVASGAFTRLVVSALAPAGTMHAAIGWTDVEGDGWSLWLGGESVDADDANVTIGQLLPFFSGDTPNTAQYDYIWTGAANASASERVTLDISSVDPLADPDCPPLPVPPTPPSIDDPCIDPVGTWRRYWAIVGEQEVSAWQDTVPTLTLATGDVPARQVRIRYWANPEGILPEDFERATGWEAEQIISYLPAHAVLTVDGVSERVWASVAGGGSRAADRLLYGSGGSPATWPVLSCGIGYLISFDVPLDAPVGNLTTDIALTRRM